MLETVVCLKDFLHTGLNTRIVQAEEKISEVKFQLNEIKRED